MIRALVLCPVLLSVGVMGCVGEGDLQIFRADIMALERSQHQRERALMRQLDAFEMRAAQPIEEREALRREAVQRAAAIQELQAEIKQLGDTIQDLRHRMPPDAGVITAMQAKLNALGTRLDAVADRAPAPQIPRQSPPAGRQEPSATPVAVSSPSRPASTPAQPELAATKPEPRASPALVSSSGYTATRLYREALQVYQKGSYDGAVELFKQFLYQHGQSPLAGEAQYRIGESLYAQRQYEKAVVAFDDVMQKYPDDAKVPAAMFKQALAFAELRDINSARLILQQIREKYANSPEATQATEKLKQLRY